MDSSNSSASRRRKKRSNKKRKRSSFRVLSSATSRIVLSISQGADGETGMEVTSVTSDLIPTFTAPEEEAVEMVVATPLSPIPVALPAVENAKDENLVDLVLTPEIQLSLLDVHRKIMWSLIILN